MTQRRMVLWSTLPAAIVLGALSILPAFAAEEETWMTLLRLQLEQSYNCAMDKMLFFRETPLGHSVSLEGRVRCLDQREFDFSRPRATEKFEIRLCLPTVC